jgi:hypothetical protein
MTTAIESERRPRGRDAEASTLAIGDTLTVVSGCLGGDWVLEDDNGVVYLATAVE